MKNIDQEDKKLQLKPDIVYCKRCGRELKSPESKIRGMGKTCFLKYLRQVEHKNKLF